MRRESQRRELEGDKKQGQEKGVERRTKIMGWGKESYQEGLENTCKCSCALLSVGWLSLSHSLARFLFLQSYKCFFFQLGCVWCRLLFPFEADWDHPALRAVLPRSGTGSSRQGNVLTPAMPLAEKAEPLRCPLEKVC